MENKKQLTKQEKDIMAEKCWLYQKHYGEIQKYLRFNKYDYEDMKISLEKANLIYQKKLGQLNSIIFTLDMLFSSNSYYELSTRELLSWSIDLMSRRLKLYLENQLKDLIKE